MSFLQKYEVERERMKIGRIVILLGLVIVLCLSAIPVLATSTIVPTKREYVETGGNADSQQIYGGNYVAEIFQTSSDAHSISYINVDLKKVVAAGGSVGYVYIGLRAVSGGVPVGSNIFTYPVNGDTLLTTSYQMCTFNITDYTLEPSTSYALIVQCNGGTAGTNYIMWHQSTTGDGDVNSFGLHSTDSGVSWTSDAVKDYLFQIYGNPVFQVVGAEVFENYITTGDWLFVVEAINAYPTLSTTQPSEKSFYIQLLDPSGSQILAATTLKKWGYAPESIYLSPAMVKPLTHSTLYKIRMIDATTGSVYTDYQLKSSDWVGSDKKLLDAWCIRVAQAMNLYNGDTLTNPYTKNSTILGGTVLTAGGGADFVAGIPNIMQIRPDLFETSVQKPAYDSGTATNAYDNAHVFTTQVGTQIASDVNSLGAVFGVTGLQAAQMGLWLLYAMTIIFIFISTNRAEMAFALVISVPILFIGVHFGVVELYQILVACVFAVLLFVLKAWFSR